MQCQVLVYKNHYTLVVSLKIYDWSHGPNMYNKVTLHVLTLTKDIYSNHKAKMILVSHCRTHHSETPRMAAFFRSTWKRKKLWIFSKLSRENWTILKEIKTSQQKEQNEETVRPRLTFGEIKITNTFLFSLAYAH